MSKNSVKVEFTKIFKKKDDMGNLLGFCNVSVAGLTIRGCKLFNSEKGKFVSTPSEPYKDKDGKTQYKYIVKIDDEDLIAEIKDAVLEEYEK